MTDFVTVPDSLIPAEEWRSYRARAFIFHMVHEAGGSYRLKEEHLTGLPLGRLVVEETPDATVFRYVPDAGANLITNDGEMMAAVLVHHAGGKVRLTRHQEAMFSGCGLWVDPNPSPRRALDGRIYDDIELHLVRLKRPLQEGEG